MVYKNHLLTIYVNNQLLTLESEDVNLRLNATVFNPIDISSTQSEYSFSFEVPAIAENNKIFQYANCLDKPSKFHNRYDAKVYADEQLIFEGTLIINSYKDNKYNCNLVAVKTYSLDEIFGEDTLNKIPWYKPFNGISSINSYNASGDTEIAFPLISYGVFQKTPYFSDTVANDYTSKFQLDEYNKWWVESFFPSLNMLQTVKKAFEWKGYTVGGDAFNDEILKNVYMSCNLSSEQQPLYNLGNERMGKVSLTTRFYSSTEGYEQELKFPYFHVKNGRAGFGSSTSVNTNTKTYEDWNFKTVQIYDLLRSGTTIVNQPTYMFDDNEKCIVIPADGWYKIDLRATCTLESGEITAVQNVITDGGAGDDIEEKELTMQRNLYETCPVEIQLVRNYNDNLELIKGKWNTEYSNGNPTETMYRIGTRYYNNINQWQTCFPHDDPYNTGLPTKLDGISLMHSRGSSFSGQKTGEGTINTIGGSRSGKGSDFGKNRRGGGTSTTPRNYSYGDYGYVYVDNEIMAYDPVVNSDFICGVSSMGINGRSGCKAVIKNGYSWTRSFSEETNAFYDNNGYLHLTMGTGNTVNEEQTTYNSNTYGAPATTIISNANTLSARFSCMVYLYKNDVLELFQVNRGYNNAAGNVVTYPIDTTVDLDITAMSERSYNALRADDFNYSSTTEFDVDLRLSNFLNDETTIASFIQNVMDAYNIEIKQYGKTITIDTKKIATTNNPPIINLDNRVNSNDAESELIEYPSTLAVQYKIDTDEWGFEQSAPPNTDFSTDDWKKYGDSGFTKIILNDDNYNIDDEVKNINFSYTWYDDFKWIEVDSADTADSGTVETLSIPVISKFEYMIDGYNYDEAMQHDGYSLTQRFWFKPTKTNAFVWTDSYPFEKVDIYTTSNVLNNVNLSYKNTEQSILTNYFNYYADLSSNYVNIDVYITPDEYKLLKNGANVKFDDDVYIPVEIIGYDPTGNNKTSLKLMKR